MANGHGHSQNRQSSNRRMASQNSTLSSPGEPHPNPNYQLTQLNEDLALKLIWPYSFISTAQTVWAKP